MLSVLKQTTSCFVVDKLQFEPPLRKETEARDEMVRTSLGFPSFLKTIGLSLLCSSALSSMYVSEAQSHDKTTPGPQTITTFLRK